MKIDLGYIDMCKQTYRNLEETKALFVKATRPVVTDISLIESICNIVRAVFGEEEKQSVVIRAQELVVLYLYAPVKLITKNGERSKVMEEFMRVTNQTRFKVSMYRTEAIAYYRINKGFRVNVDRAMSVITEELLS